MGLKRIQNGKGERGNLEISLSVNPTHAYVSSLHRLGWVNHVLAKQSLKAAVKIDPHNESLTLNFG